MRRHGVCVTPTVWLSPHRPCAGEDRGNEDAARKSYQNFLTLWKDADPDIPIYKQAKAECAGLK
jgi:hypothetical protein